jgi:hypothetical protein
MIKTLVDITWHPGDKWLNFLPEAEILIRNESVP